MKIIKKNVYYCDFCNKKRGLSAGAMAKHEKHCTANPDRECRLCGRTYPLRKYIDRLKKRFEIIESEPDEYDCITQTVKWHGKEITLKEVLGIADNCPNCTLAILRQTKLNYAVFDFKYDYKIELAGYWDEKNADESDHYRCY